MHTIEAENIPLGPAILEKLRAGESVLVQQAQETLALILPMAASDQPRPSGLCKGDFVVPDDFNEPLEDWGDLGNPVAED